MDYDIEFLTFILAMVVPVKVLPWVFIAALGYKGLLARKAQRDERERQRRMARLAELRKPKQEPEPTLSPGSRAPISADHLQSMLIRRG
ncbi:hypothetical protein [Ferrimonas marina]|uniref:Uncharacterized protein n=1 Tax=Ferrimonas marina TaxID=299255 RepID=A0A1M5QYW0_9GAMM|nr:hypothetical protein [Ferrimonas marina]SHH19088.1 hypothetical protein SAMN02745129_1411 [Ferrimonas marina]